MAVLSAAAAGPSILWYLARGTGTVALLLLSASVVLGVSNVRRLQSPRLPRFVVDGLHRSVSLLVLAVLAVHILSSVLDSFAHIGLVSALVPFASSYRPFWLGLGAISFELLIALAATSVMRQRIGYGTWRAVHWLAYAAWPVALVHGFGTGTDGRTSWMLALSGACVVAVVAAVLFRVAAGWPADRERRIAAGALAILGPVLLGGWLSSGPLAAGWARRAGTPVALLGTRPVAALATSGPPAGIALPFTTQVAGRIRQTTTADTVTLDISLTDASRHAVAIRIIGRPSPGGGVAMTDSLVSLGTTSRPSLYRGTVVGLAGGNVTASLSRGGQRVRLDASLSIVGASVDGSATVSAAA